MSAAEIIEQIKALSPEDKAKVRAFVREDEPEIPSLEKQQGEVEAAGAWVIKNYAPLLKELAK